MLSVSSVNAHLWLECTKVPGSTDTNCVEVSHAHGSGSADFTGISGKKSMQGGVVLCPEPDPCLAMYIRPGCICHCGQVICQDDSIKIPIK